MSTTSTPFTSAALAEVLSRCLAATATDRCLADVLEVVRDVQEGAATLLAVARHLEEEMDVDPGAVVLGGWAGDVVTHVPDTVPPAWLDAGGAHGELQ